MDRGHRPERPSPSVFEASDSIVTLTTFPTMAKAFQPCHRPLPSQDMRLELLNHSPYPVNKSWPLLDTLTTIIELIRDLAMIGEKQVGDVYKLLEVATFERRGNLRPYPSVQTKAG